MTTKTMEEKTARQIENALEFAEVNGRYAGDTREIMRSERERLQGALASGNPQRISAAKAEAIRVAKMWAVEL